MWEYNTGVLGYGMIVQGNSSWHYSSVIFHIPAPADGITIQIDLGWVIVTSIPETVSFRDISLYIVK